MSRTELLEQLAEKATRWRRTRVGPNTQFWDSVTDDMIAAIDALAAVAPLIAQAERERCLAVARRWTRDGQSATAHGIILGIEELDAIRARSTEAGQ